MCMQFVINYILHITTPTHGPLFFRLTHENEFLIFYNELKKNKKPGINPGILLFKIFVSISNQRDSSQILIIMINIIR